MGDKSPKANNRKKKQDKAQKDQKKADAQAKAHREPAAPERKKK